jgi:hypothetical protein
MGLSKKLDLAQQIVIPSSSSSSFVETYPILIFEHFLSSSSFVFVVFSWLPSLYTLSSPPDGYPFFVFTIAHRADW